MSASLVKAAVRCKLPPSVKSVLLQLAWYARETHGSIAWPSVATISERTGLGRRAVQMALSFLQRCGAIAIDGGWSKGGRERSTRYHLTLDDPIAISERAQQVRRLNADKRAQQLRPSSNKCISK